MPHVRTPASKSFKLTSRGLPHLCGQRRPDTEGCNARLFGIWLRLADMGTEASLVDAKDAVATGNRAAFSGLQPEAYHRTNPS